jgi:hypothetical protein
VVRKLLKLSSLIVIAVLLTLLAGCPVKSQFYELDIQIEEGEGSVTASPLPEDGRYLENTEVTLTAVAGEGYEFSKWEVGGEEFTDNPLTITMDGDKTVKVYFEEEEPEPEVYTLTMLAPEGNGEVDPEVGEHEYDEGEEVTLTATADEGWQFEKWVIDGTDVEENPTTITMEADVTAKAIFVSEAEAPTVSLSWTTGNVMTFIPCEANLTIRFQALVGDPANKLTSAKYIVENVETGDKYEVPIDVWYTAWTREITDADLLAGINDPIPGGRYTLTVIAANEYGLETEKSLNFWVKNAPAELEEFVLVEADDQIVEFEGLCLVTPGATPATVQATVTYDSAVTVRLYLVESTYSGLEDIIAKGSRLRSIPLKTDGPITEMVEIELPNLAGYMLPGKEYRLYFVLFVPECGDPTCLDCGIEAWEPLDCYLLLDTDPELECLPCECEDPCDPCFDVLGFNPGVRVKYLADQSEDFFDVMLEIDGEPYTGDIERVDETATYVDFRVTIFRGDLEPELSGEHVFTWTVKTVTDVEVSVDCDIEMDLVPPEIDIWVENCCMDDDTTMTAFKVTFTDNYVGLKYGFVKVVGGAAEYEDTVTAGPNSYKKFELEGLEDTVAGTITINDPNTPFTIYAYAEDENCNVSDVASKTCQKKGPPLVDFGPKCPTYCPPDCDATSIVMFWGIDDDLLEGFEIEVSHGSLVSNEMYEKFAHEGHITWNLGNINCETITATMTVWDECGNVKVKTWKSPNKIDNVPPKITCFEWLEAPTVCSTYTELIWAATDPCFDKIVIIPSHGEIETYSATDNTEKVRWVYEDAVDCEQISVTLKAYDECGNVATKTLTSSVAVDNMEPEVDLAISKWPEGEPFVGELCTYDATCLWIDWAVIENCLDEVWLYTNYPLYPCGQEPKEREKGLYKYDPFHISYYLFEDESKDGRLVQGGWIEFCLPYIDCDTFVATLTAIDTSGCTDWVFRSWDIFIDNQPPRIDEFNTGLMDECSTATTTIISWEVTDGSYEYIGSCDIGRLSVSHGYLESDSATGTEMYFSSPSGTVTWNLGALNYVDVVATLTAWDVCCASCREPALGVDSFEATGAPILIGAEVSKTLKQKVDNVPPKASLYFVDQQGLTKDATFCAATSTVLSWAASDTVVYSTEDGTGCLSKVVIELSHGTIDGMNPWKKTLSATNTADGTLTWEFGMVSGETVFATITAFDCCGNESDVEAYCSSVSAYVRNAGPQLFLYRFDANDDIIIIEFTEDVVADDATATLYVWDETITDWVSRAEYAASNTASDISVRPYGIDTPLSDKSTVHIDAKLTETGNPVSILPNTKYKLELWGIYTEDPHCGPYDSYPMPIVFDGFGTTYSPGF